MATVTNTVSIKKGGSMQAALAETNPEYIYFASESVGEGHPDKLCD